jgi:Co/Zn/Cd efflux system component
MADALTSVLAIFALLAGRYLSLNWMDPVMGVIGCAVILAWSWSLLRAAGAVLLDVTPGDTLRAHIREHLEVAGDKVSDLHVWRLGPGHLGAIVSIISDRPQPPAVYKARLAAFSELSHVTVEVEQCPNHPPGHSPGLAA